MDQNDSQILLDHMLTLMNIINRVNRSIGEQDGKGPVPLSPMQVQALIAIRRSDTLNMTELSRQLYATKSQATKIVDSLVRAGLVDRRNDPASRRVILIHLTDKGDQYMKEILLSDGGLLAKVFHLMSDEEKDKVTEASKILARSFAKILTK